MIKIQNISKTFQTETSQVTALEDVSLTINKGEIYGIIGLSGAGKSTLIRTINRLESPSKGSILIDNVELTSLKENTLRKQRQKIGMIFQHFNLLSSRTVAGNIAFPLEVAKVKKDLHDEIINKLLEQVGLSDKRTAYPSQLSGGQKQRVAIARALANNPDILLCDEATSALDPRTTKAILQLLKEINHQTGITIVLITHQMNVIHEICDKVAIIEHGKIIEEDTVQAVFTQPKTATGKEFIEQLQFTKEVS
jgi:D-methionine transport system ATP-binding protein